MATNPNSLQNIDILNVGVDSFLVNTEKGLARFPASRFPENFTADKLLMPDGVTSIADHYRYFSNPNLLINWYFADPVNQRRQTKYTGYGCTIDQWRIADATLKIEPDGVVISNTADKQGLFYYRTEQPLKGRELTLSLLAAEITGDCHIALFSSRKKIAAGLNTVTVKVPESNTQQEIYLLHYLTGTIKIIAAKLEPGTRQTLAHKEGDTWVLNDPPPDKALELLKCQRYQVVIGGNNFSFCGIVHGISNTKTAYISLVVPVPLRTTPTARYMGVLRAILFDKNGQRYTKTSEVFEIRSIAKGIYGNTISCILETVDAIFESGMTGFIDTNTANDMLIVDANL